MTSEQFSQTYLLHEQDISNILHKQNIFDEDLLHDTYIALYEHSQRTDINDFVSTFVAFYRTRCQRRDKHESPLIACDNATLIEHFDRPDESDWKYREHISQRVDDIIDKFIKNPVPGEHHHERACQVLQLYRDGLTFREIAAQLNIDVAAVHRHLGRSIARIKSQQKMAI